MDLTFALHGGPSISEEHGHKQVQVAVRFKVVGIVGYAEHHGPQHIIQQGGCLIQDDAGPCQEAI